MCLVEPGTQTDFAYVIYSIQRLLCRVASYLSPANDGPLICAGMVRNEIDILDIWVSHLCSIFDRVIIYDHLSTDGTRERLHELARSQKKLEIRHFDELGHYQSKLMTSVMFEVTATTKSGWIFFLDADEFLMVRHRSDIVRQLHRYRAAPALRMVWANAYPIEMQSIIGPDTQIAGFLDQPKPVRKVAVNLRLAGSFSRINQGNHRARFKRLSVLANTIIWEPRILHLPIRTERQIRSKAKLGFEATENIVGENTYALHWKQIASTNELPDIRWLVYSYGYLWENILENQVAPPEPTLTGRLDQLVNVGRNQGPNVTL